MTTWRDKHKLRKAPGEPRNWFPAIVIVVAFLIAAALVAIVRFAWSQ